MNKKGSHFGFDMMNFIPRGLYWVAVIVFAIMFGSMVLNINIDIIDGETKLIATSLINSPDSFIYYENGRAYPGVIDYDKFIAEKIPKAFNINKTDQKFWGYNITLLKFNGDKIYSIVENEVWHARWKIIAGASGRGSGAAWNVVTKYYVLIKYTDRVEKGILIVDITRPT